MKSKADQFRDLAADLAPHQDKANTIKAKMMKLAHAMNIEIITESFPSATPIEYRALAEIRPTDLAKAASDTADTIRKAIAAGTCPEPNLIIIDRMRMTVTIGQKVPPAGQE